MFSNQLRLSAPAFSRLVISALALALTPSLAEAARIVIDEAGLNAIYSQPAFGETPIAIRFNAPIQIVAPDLLKITTAAQLQALYRLAPDPAPTVTAFFIDDLDICGQVEPVINGVVNGCAQLPGHIFVEDFTAAELEPAILMGHELGHNLNLQHDFFSGLNLMFPLFPHGMELTESQVATILQSPLVQTDANGQRFIQITPIAIVDVPEPATAPLLGVALGALLILSRHASEIAAWRRPDD